MEDKVKEILAKWFKDLIDKPCAYCEASKEIVAKLQSHYRDMTPAELREEIYMVLYELVKTFGEGLKPGKGSITVKPSIDRILSLVNGNLIERIKRIENPYKGDVHLDAGVYDGLFKKVFNDTIQEVIKEMEE